jgi:hypothetical protein
MKLRATPVSTRFSTQVAPATAIPIRGIRSVFILHKGTLGRRRRGVALQVQAVCVAERVRRTRRLIAPWHRTLHFRRHHRARRLHDLPDALSCQADTPSDRGERLPCHVPGHDGGVAPIDAVRLGARADAAERSSGLSLRSESSALATHAVVA